MLDHQAPTHMHVGGLEQEEVLDVPGTFMS